MRLPVPPDPDNQTEIWFLVQMVGALARANTEVFILLLLLMMMYGILYVLFITGRYLFTVYRVRAFPPSPHYKTFRYLLGGALLFTALGLYQLLDGASSGLGYQGFALLCYTFMVFSLASAGLDWFLSREEALQGEQEQQRPSLDSLTAEEVIAWQSEVNEAYKAGLKPGV